MRIRPSLLFSTSVVLGAALLFFPSTGRAELSWDLTVLPNASVRFRGEGKVQPQSYVNRFGGNTSPVYRLTVSQPAKPEGFWSLSLWHTGVFGGGEYAEERVPDAAGGTYQTNQLNVGFTNAFVTYHRGVSDWPVEALVSLSVAREIFKRKDFIVQGVDTRPTRLDDVNEISAEGIGFGLAGKHGDRFYGRWQALASYYVQIFDAETDSHAGQIFQAEGGLGARVWKSLSVEAGYLWQYWFILSQGNRRLHVNGTEGAVISWNRQETRASGAYVKLQYKFGQQK